MLKKLLNIPRLLFALAALALAMPIDAKAQGFLLPDGSTALGHLNASGPPPVGTGCTIAALSTDAAGTCTTSAASGTIVFARAFTVAPRCVVVDATATPLAVYTTTTTQITLTTVTSAHVLYWVCFGTQGG